MYYEKSFARLPAFRSTPDVELRVCQDPFARSFDD